MIKLFSKTVLTLAVPLVAAVAGFCAVALAARATFKSIWVKGYLEDMSLFFNVLDRVFKDGIREHEKANKSN